MNNNERLCVKIKHVAGSENNQTKLNVLRKQKSFEKVVDRTSIK